MKRPAPARRIAVVASRFNAEIVDRLVASCLDTLEAEGVPKDSVCVVRVPGAFEIPWAAKRLAASGDHDAVVCLGAVLKGQTPQNHYISQSVFRELHRISTDTGVPCVLGVITPDTWVQAKARTRGSMDRGKESALAALEMAALKAEFDRPSGSR